MTTPLPDQMPPFIPNPDQFDDGKSRRRERSRRWTAMLNSMSDTNGAALLFGSRPQSEILLLQSVIVLGEKTSEGRIVEAVDIPWLEIFELLVKDPNAMFQLDAPTPNAGSGLYDQKSCRMPSATFPVTFPDFLTA
jgi:hypothetical protein